MPNKIGEAAAQLDELIQQSASRLSLGLNYVQAKDLESVENIEISGEVLAQFIKSADTVAASTIKEAALLVRRLRAGRETLQQHPHQDDDMLRAFDWFEFGIHLVQSAFNVLQDEVGDANASPLHEALYRLTISGVRTAEEIGYLLRGGFGRGAFARWRTLDEVAIVMRLISKTGNDTAKRFLRHRHVKQHEDMTRMKELLRLQEDLPSGLRAEIGALREEYGEDYMGGYGWARAAMKSLDPSFKGSISLSRIQQHVGLQTWEVHHRLAAHRVHATSQFAQEYSVVPAVGGRDDERGAIFTSVSSSLMSMDIMTTSLLALLSGLELNRNLTEGTYGKLLIHALILRKAYDEVVSIKVIKNLLANEPVADYLIN